ncbi:MAG: YgjV family protein [Bacilli bacterium]|nr:YgjV family protein [Bacilli bacterium]
MITSFQCDDKNKLLKLQIFSCFSYAFQYLCLGAISGFLMNIVSSIRNAIFKKYDNKKAPLWVLIFLILLITFLSLFGYKGSVSLLPTVAILTYSFAAWTADIRLMRLMQVLAGTLFFIYDVISLAIVGAIGNFILVVSVLISIYRFDIKGKKHA